MTVIIYLIGKPGTGKYTIAKEIALHGYSICDNQLANNPIFSLLNYDGITPIPDFAWLSIERIRESIFDFISQEPDNNYVFTNVLYDVNYDHKIYAQVEKIAGSRKSAFIPVKLLISEAENIKRIQNPERRLRYKSLDVTHTFPKHPLIPIGHPNLIELDVSELMPQESAHYILKKVKELTKR